MKRACVVSCASTVGLGGVLVVAGVAWGLANATFVERLVTYPFGDEVTAVDWYEPREPIESIHGAPLPTAHPSEVDLDPSELEKLAEWAERHGSCALVVLRRGQVVLERYGENWSGERSTQSFSMAKTLLGLTVGRAVAEGHLRIEDSVGVYLPEWRGQEHEGVTVLDLLRMQSGLRYDNSRRNPFSDMVQVHLAADLEPLVLGLPVEVPPGTRFQYSNLDSQVLGLVLERATGRRYAELVSEAVWRPIGAIEASVWLDREGGRAKTYCCVFATARDWARVGELMRLGGRWGDRQVVPEEWIARMIEPSPLYQGYGMHVWLRGGNDAPRCFVLDGKSKQRVWVVPDLEAVIVRLGENSSGWNELEAVRLLAAAARDR